MLRNGDILELYINDEFFKNVPRRRTEKLGIQFAVIYEDENILIVDKPVGLRCHSDKNEDHNTLIEQVKQYLQDKGDYIPEKEQSFSPSLCNRLDINTQGLVIAAKNAAALRTMNEKIKSGEVVKSYVCAVSGIPSPNSDVLTGFLCKDVKENKAFISKAELQGGKKVITEYKVIKSNGFDSLLEIKLHTGRFHQIRAHMAYIGHPLIGDKKYGGKTSCPYQLLCANKIYFDFYTPAGPIQYLNKKEVALSKTWFEDVI